jgi:FAD-dependent urate hydroxylase
LDDLRIAIVGAGIGGLTAGIALRRAGFDVHLFERAPQLAPVGFGLLLQPNGVKALCSLGLGRELAQVSPRLGAVVMRDQSGAVLSDIDIEPLVRSVGQRPRPVARADLFDMLAGGFGRGSITLGAECVGVEQDDERATVVFANGDRFDADLVVGADGLRSAIRPHVAPDATLNYLWAGWETLIPADPALTPADTFTFWIGDGRRAALMPVAGARCYCFFDFPPEDEHAETEVDVRTELREAYGDWCAPVRTMVERIDVARTHPVRYFDLDPLESFVRGRVVLIGDAAHATTPSLGQGASQAIEDAVVLAHYLLTTDVHLGDALARYDAERRDRTQAIVLAARAMTQRIVGTDPEETARWKAGLREGSRDYIGIAEEITLTGPLR